MPSLEEQADSPFVRMMVIGHSGTGKTGALTSLAKAGYRLRILDLDHNLASLVNHVKDECPEALKRIDYMSFRDTYKPTAAGPVLAGPAKAYPNAARALDKWEDGSTPSEWGQETVLVVDTLTSLGNAAFAWARAMNPLSNAGNKADGRQWYGAAQESLETLIATMTADTFHCHLIVNSHIDLITMPDGSLQGFATTIGKALGPKVPRYFSTLAAIEIKGQGANVRRVIRTMPTNLLTLKNPAPKKIAAEYPIETGLADLFSKLRGKS